MRPTDDQLCRFLLGNLHPEESDMVVQWVESAPEAVQVLERLNPKDPWDAVFKLCNDSPPQGTSNSTEQSPFTDPSTRPRLPDPPADAPVIPGYHITAEIAKGGMGQVYAAVHLALDREVAIKTLLPRANAGRFVTESKITARLPHPNIPPVHELGELADGTPFLAMKLVRGATLSELLKARPNPRHDLPRFLQIFEQIAQAVGFAHSRGVIHRDLKPLNVMVGEFGEVQVMDWGLAKETERVGVRQDPVGSENRVFTHPSSPSPDLTQAGTVMGTPGYMAPEQARGQLLDARADVFALGSILAIILTGQPAFIGDDALDLLVKTAEEELNEVGARLDRCGADGELVALAQHCLAADRQSRPANGQLVAAAVAAYRAGVEERSKRLEAERAEAVVREAEQRKRRRALTWAGGIALAILCAGIIGTTLGMVSAEYNRGEAEKARVRERERADGEAAAQRKEREARNKGLDVLDMVTSGVTSDALSTQMTVTKEQKKLLQEVLPLYQDYAAENGNDENTRARIARSAFNVGMIQAQLVNESESLEAFKQAKRIYRELTSAFPNNSQYRRALSLCCSNMGVAYNRVAKREDSERELLAAKELQERLVADFPDAHEYRHHLALTYGNLGDVYFGQRRFNEAMRQSIKAIEIREQLAAEVTEVPEYRYQLAVSRTKQGVLLRNMNNLAGAEQEYRQAQTVLVGVLDKFPYVAKARESFALNHQNIAVLLEERNRQVRLGSYGLYGSLFWSIHQQQLKEVDDHYNRGITELEKLVANFPAVSKYRLDLGGGLLNYGTRLASQATTRETREASVKWMDQAIQYVRGVNEEEPDNDRARQSLIKCYGARATAMQFLNRHAEAVNNWDAVVELSTKDEGLRYRSRRAYAKLNAKLFEDAVAEVTELRKLGGWPVNELYNFACIYSVASEQVAGQQQNYADQAMELLRQAVAAGWKDHAHIRNDTDFAPIRHRDDFKKLLVELAAKRK